MKIGVRAHDYGRFEVKALAQLLKQEGYDAAQLVLPKVFAGVDSYAAIDGRLIETIREEFDRQKIEIAVFGCYMDLANPNQEIRQKAVATFCDCLIWAKELGAGVIGTETAYARLSAKERKEWQPYMLDSIWRILEKANAVDMTLALEPVYWHPLTGLEEVQEVLHKAQDNKHLKLIFDPANLLEFPATTDQDAYWTKWLSAVGEWIEVFHIKDFTVSPAGEYVPRLLGEGVLKYDAIAAWVKANRPDSCLIREEMVPAEAQRDIRFLKEMF